MRLKRLLIAVCLLLVTVLLAVAIAVAWLVPGWLAPTIAASVKAETGRDLSIGEVTVSLLPRPALVLSQVRLANAAWGSQPWLAQVGRASAEPDLLALLLGRLRVRHVTLSGATLLIETDAAGTGNWVLGSAGAAKPALPEAFQIDKLTLQSIAFTYRDTKSGKATSVQIDSAVMAAASATDSIELSARATLDGKSVEVAGTVGPLAALIANTPSPVDLEVKVGAASVRLHGRVDQPHELGGLSLALKAQAPELADVMTLFGAAVPPLGPLRAEARLSGTLAAPVFAGVDLAAGTPGRMAFTARGDVAGKRTAAAGYEWHSSGIDLLVEGAQFGDLAAWVGRSLPSLGPYRIAARVAGTTAAPALSAIDVALGGHGLPQITLHGAIADLRAASGVDVKLVAAAADWWRFGTEAGGQRLPPFRTSARVRGARQAFRVDDIELKVADSTVNASLQVLGSGPRLRITGKVVSPLIDLSRRPPAGGAAGVPSAAPKSPQPTEHWKLADVDLDLQIARLVFPGGRDLRSGSGSLALEDGRLNVSALKATLGGANVQLDGSIAEPANLAGIDVNVALQGSELADLSSFFGKAIPPVGPYRGQARLQGSFDALRLTAIDATAGRPAQRLRVSGEMDDVLQAQGLALAVTADINDSTAAGRLVGLDLPRLPALRATARVSGPQGGYVVDDLRLTLGRTSLQGRIAFAPGEPRPRLTAKLSGPLVDLSELPVAPGARAKPDAAKPGASSPTLLADIDADIHFDRVVLPDRRSLGAVGGVARLTAGALEFKQFSVALDGASVTVDGTVSDPLKLAQLELMVQVEVKRGSGLAAFTGLNLRELPAFTASAKLADAVDGYALSGLKIATAATTMAGDLALTRGAKRFKVSTKLHAALLDASAFARPAAAGGGKQPTAAGTRAIADVALPIDALGVIDADVELRIDSVKLGDAAPLGSLLARVLMTDGRLKAEPVQLTGEAGQVLGVSGTIDVAQAAWDLRVQAQRLDLGEIFKRFGKPGLVTGGMTEGVLQLRGRGKTLHALLASLDGEARVQVGPLLLRKVAVNLDAGIVSRTIGLANPLQEPDPDIDVKCVAARVPIKSGVLTSGQGIAAETAKYNLVLHGSVNLGTEAIDIAVTPVVKGGLGVGSASIARIVRVGGTLGAPALGVDAAGVAKSAVNAGVAVVAAPWWLADAVLKKVRSDPNPCATALGK